MKTREDVRHQLLNITSTFHSFLCNLRRNPLRDERMAGDSSRLLAAMSNGFQLELDELRPYINNDPEFSFAASELIYQLLLIKQEFVLQVAHVERGIAYPAMASKEAN